MALPMGVGKFSGAFRQESVSIIVSALGTRVPLCIQRCRVLSVHTYQESAAD